MKSIGIKDEDFKLLNEILKRNPAFNDVDMIVHYCIRKCYSDFMKWKLKK